MPRHSSTEFGALKSLGLQIKPIRGDGNCLFNALSDQIYGHQERNLEIRQAVTEYMRENAEMFKPFLAVEAPKRRAPKRKAAGSISTKNGLNFSAATEDQLDVAFESHLIEMAKSGTWADNMEIMAFTHAYKTDVRVFREEGEVDIKSAHDGTTRPMAYIAYHDYEHYSSVCSIGGPMMGLPNIQLPSTSEAVKDLVPHQIKEEKIAAALETTNGNVVKTMATDYPTPSSSAVISSSPGGTSIERDSDPEDEDICPPPKRRSRAPAAQKSSQRKSGDQDSGSDYEPAKASRKKAKRPVKRASGARKGNQKKKAGQAMATSSSDFTSSEFDRELSRSASRTSNTTVSDAVETAVAKEEEDKVDSDIEEGEIKEPIQIEDPAEVKESTEVKESVEIRGPVEVKKPIDAGGESSKSGHYSSGSEAEDEFRPGNDIYDFASSSDSSPSKAKKSSGNQKRKTTTRTKGVQKRTGKTGKKSKTDEKVLEEAVKEIEKERSQSPPAEISTTDGGDVLEELVKEIGGERSQSPPTKISTTDDGNAVDDGKAV